MSNPRVFNPKKLSLLCLLFALPLSNLTAADTNAPALPAPQPEENSISNEALRAFLQLQEQLHDTQLAVERNQQEAQTAAAQNSQILSNHLQAIEQSLLVQRANELADTERTNHLLLIFIGLFALFAFAAALFTAYIQWRALNQLAEISASLPVARALPGLASTTALGPGEHDVLAGSAMTQSHTHLVSLIQLLEKRIAEMEHTAAIPLKELPTGNGEIHQVGQPVTESKVDEKTARITSLLQHGQSLLNDDHPEDAVACFDQVLALAPNHAETLVKKGAALEKMRQPQEALDCYNRAINADHSMTIAYLHKGGLCNRLERYSEAMECYQQALHTQEKKRAA